MNMEMVNVFLKELDQESKTTRKFLTLVPADKFDWRPHAKSMTMISLATHIAELPTWISMTLTTTELDFAKNAYEPKAISSNSELLQLFESSLAEGRNQLQAASEADLLPDWTLRNGEEIYSTTSKAEVIRMVLSQIIHHRAQLGVYLRLLDIPIPGSYGPSADDMSF
jgi:uncharacterized damage-inducible protein DinB